MRTKPALIGARASLLVGTILAAGLASPVQAAPPPTLVLYPRALGSPDDVRALVDLRKTLRADGRFDVLTYDPASAAMVRAAGDAHRADLLNGPMSADGDRLILTRALGAAFFAVVSKADGRGKSDVHLVEAAPSARAWNILDKKTDDAAHAIEEQATDALQHPALATARPALVRPPAAVMPKPTPPVNLAPMPTVKPPVPAPPPAAPTIVAPSSTPIPAPATVPATPPAVPAPAPATQTEIAPSSTPIPAPASVAIAPAPPSAPPVDDLSGVQTQLQQGDALLAQGDFVRAISVYRAAINGAPLSVVPRLKLAQTYLEADMRDKALDEARRALQIAPGSAAIQQFLMQLDAQSGTSDGAVARFSAQVSLNPQDPMAHVELGDALWNNNTLDQAESEYKTAQSLAGPGAPAAETAAAHLARLYAAQKRYDDSLAALKQAGPGGYALALGIVQSRADTLSSTLDSAQDMFTAGKTTHADFYKTAGDVSAQAQHLADFVIKVAPPAAFKLSHLYRVQATHLLAQQAAVLVTYIETSDPALDDRAAQLGKEAQTEMLMAHAAEQRLGLWGGKQTEAKN